MIDRDSPAFTARGDQVLAGVRDTIEAHGRAIVPVHGGLMYTVGLTAQRRPELVLTGAPAVVAPLLDELAGWCLKSAQNRVPLPLWAWTCPRTGTEHTFATRRYHPRRDAAGPLGLAAALYGDRVRAMHIDLTSCPCAMCVDKVLVDDAGNQRPYKP